MRPLTWSPTGIVIGCPVETASIPLRKPAVLSIATVRTVSSPMCCCTSATKILPSGRLISKASWMRGRRNSASRSFPSKKTSITGPMTCEICPISCDISNLLLLINQFFILQPKDRKKFKCSLKVKEVFLEKINKPNNTLTFVFVEFVRI